ncbi:DJ-1/PfpI family protein [Flagellimonas allohymeniacidonis]|uniref:DJ-1/PfpI family protein n=1 Tax=Flagellimonas allohymeniacidonis TaxID=2517819 RepID=A0A4Q8QBP4_9FLAO|nr:DJ-1/PfpI family protein [Allomuricauda hymeniacidonis]TAI46817.1 DJ-1/PfpI family protein [Allomuricauda hymeniacidonis]
MKKNDSKTIAFYLQDGVEVLDFAGPMEVFAYAGYQVFTVSATKSQIKSQGILKVTPDYSIEDAPNADILAFFGGNSNVAVQNPKVIDWVRQQESVQYHFSVCTGAFILAEAGVLDGKTATTFHNALENLEGSYPKVDVRKNVRFVDNGNVITTAGISAGIDGALHLVAKLQGVNVAKRTAFYMEYDNWKLGDGLILSDDNPYTNQISITSLSEFEGTYEYENNQKIELKLNAGNKDLFAVIDGMSHPIYHERGDTFSNETNRPIHFKRDSKGNILGYSLTGDGPLFKKLW